MSTYNERFQGDNIKEAFRVALDTRKFEIELYWRRATYFWAFIAATFAGYGIAATRSFEGDAFLTFLLSCLGLVLSTGWVLANRGSKRWQENWEHHVDHLEDHVTGPLFKTMLHRSTPRSLGQWMDFVIFGPSRHSVSKINQAISLYITAMWIVLLIRAPATWNLEVWPISSVLVLAVTGLALVILVFYSRTHEGSHNHDMAIRKSTINDG